MSMMITMIMINLIWLVGAATMINFVVKELTKVLREKNNFAELKESINFDYEKVHNLIDGIIEDAGAAFKIQYTNYDANGNIVFNKDNIKDMMDFMLKEAVYYITPSVETALKSIVNIETEEDLLLFLNKKIKIHVLNYTYEIRKENI